MKTSVSKTHRIRIFPKGLVHGFGQKFKFFFTVSFYAKYTDKKYLLTFSLENKPFYTKETWIKNSKISIFYKGDNPWSWSKSCTFFIFCVYQK